MLRTPLFVLGAGSLLVALLLLLTYCRSQDSTAPLLTITEAGNDQITYASPVQSNPMVGSVPILTLEQVMSEAHLDLFLREYGTRGTLLQRSIGYAEGTRGLGGAMAPGYWGHRDPLCIFVLCTKAKTNLGSFSYRESADKPKAPTPIIADQIQHQVLRLQALELLFQARREGIELSAFQLLAGIDLANQSPKAACVQQPNWVVVEKLVAGIDVAANIQTAEADFPLNDCRWGYIDRLKQSLTVKRLVGIDAVVDARLWTYFEVDFKSPRYNSWNASGFDHNPVAIERDQRRRVAALEEALRYQSQHPAEFP